MSKINGKVLVKETGIPIPDLLVSVYDRSEEDAHLKSPPDNRPPISTIQIQGIRLGSVLTDASGKFELTYGSNEKRRPKLLLVVSAPEEPRGAPPVLYTSSAVLRDNAGQTETYLIRLPIEGLKKAEIQVPSNEPEAPERVVQRLLIEEERTVEIRNALRTAIAAKRVDQERQLATEFAQTFRDPLLNTLSKVSEAARNSPTYVKPGESVLDKARSALQADIDGIVNDPEARAPVRGYIMLTEDQEIRLKDLANGSDEVSLSANQVLFDETVYKSLFGRDVGEFRPNIVFRKDPLAQVIDTRSADKLLSQSASDALPAAPNHNREVAADGIESVTVDDVPTYIARMIKNLTPPEQPIAIAVPERGTQDGVQKGIDAFQLRTGPADTPAYYDFAKLQIAFNYVWQECFDNTLVQRIQTAIREIRRLGGIIDPKTVENLFESIHSEAQNIANAAVDLEDTQVSLRLTKVSGDGHEPSGRFDPSEYTGHPPSSPANPKQTSNGDKQTQPPAGTNVLPAIVKDLKSQLPGPYAFTVFAPNTVNFGILVTYRQKWEPLNYQVGELVKTIPLSPKESRKFSKKITVKKARKEREVNNSIHTRRDESSETSRAETDIIQKAQRKTNFSLTTEGGFQLEMASGKTSANLGNEASTSSEETKKEFREAVLKAAEEYKQERTIEINTESAEESETVESGEISNPNDELAVTFLFYELQRRYRISEMIHSLTPVCLVAQEVPKPNEIDDGWLVAHDWILGRVLLDDSFQPALAYLSTKMEGERISIQELKKNVDDQRDLVVAIRDQITVIKERRIGEYAALEQAIESYSQTAGGPKEGLGERVGEAVATAGFSELFDAFGGGGSDDGNRLEAAKVRRDAAKDAYEAALREEKDTLAKLDREVTALQSMTEAYTKALGEYWNHRVQVDRLRVHIKQNILYYMQAIWSHEPPDQRFFRLFALKAPRLQANEITYSIGTTADAGALAATATAKRNAFPIRADVKLQLPESGDFTEVPLTQVADLDTLLGFKGNYAIFPLKHSNALTDFMMAPYIDPILGLHDPDDISNWTIEEFAEYVCRLKERLSAKDFEQIKNQLRDQYNRLLADPHRQSDEIVIPSGSLYIEALPAVHPILEDFKLMHRAMDVKKVQADVRKAEMENLRMAARLLAGEREDPDVEKVIQIEGVPSTVTVSPE